MSTEIKVIQFGTGNFLRAFFAPLVAQLNHQNKWDGKICMVQSTGTEKIDSLKSFSFDYPLWTVGKSGSDIINSEEIIDIIKDGIALPRDQNSLINYSRSKSLQWIVSNVTEAGFVLTDENELTGFPKSFPARLTFILWERYSFFQGDPDSGIQVLPFELIENNGQKLRQMVIEQASKWKLSKAFFTWLDKNCNFYNTLVDRIVPGKPSELTLNKFHNTKLAHPFRVQTEPYFFLAIEKNKNQISEIPFLNSDFPILLVDNIAPYSLRKVRILNGAHTAMVAMGVPKGIQTVGDFMENQSTFNWLEEMILQEVIPCLPLDQEELKAYTEEIWDRFRNPFVKHKLSDISLNSMAKLKERILKSIEVYYEKNKRLPPKLAKAFCSMIKFYLEDPDKVRDTESVKTIFSDGLLFSNKEDQATFILSQKSLWNKDLNEIEGFSRLLSRYLEE